MIRLLTFFLLSTLLPLQSIADTTHIGINAGVSSTAQSLIYGEDFGSSLGRNLLTSTVAVAGAEGSRAIGDLYHAGTIGKPEQLLLHSVVGCAQGAAISGNCGAGAAGQVAGELAAEVYYNQQLKNGISPDEIYTLQGKGGNVGEFAGALASMIVGGDSEDIYAGSGFGRTAAENNAWYLIAGLAAAAAGYTVYAGDGDPKKGLETIGKGDDPLSKAVESGVIEGVTLSYENYPETTKATLAVLGAVDGAIDATVTYVDDATGKIFSRSWNELDQGTQYRLMGLGTVLSVAIPEGSVGKIAELKNLGRIDGVDIPYDSRTIRSELEGKYGAENVVSTTVPPSNAPNVKLAGQRHPETDVVFDNKGFPIFDDIAEYDMRIPANEFEAMSYTQQMQAASRDLAEAIDNGQIPASQFSERQLQQIRNGNAQIDELTWHHHQDMGRMQLVPREKHDTTRHIGGNAIQQGR